MNAGTSDMRYTKEGSGGAGGNRTLGPGFRGQPGNHAPAPCRAGESKWLSGFSLLGRLGTKPDAQARGLRFVKRFAGLALIIALALFAVCGLGLAVKAEAAGKLCYSDSNGAVRAGHVPCSVAMRVLHRAAEHYKAYGLGGFRVHVNGTWRCYSARVYHPSAIATNCTRGRAFVVIVAGS